MIASQLHVLGEDLAESAVDSPDEAVVDRVQIVADRVDHQGREHGRLLSVQFESFQLRGDSFEEWLDLSEDREDFSNAVELGAVATKVVGAAWLAHGLEELDGVQGAAEQTKLVVGVNIDICNWKKISGLKIIFWQDSYKEVQVNLHELMKLVHGWLISFK